MERWSPEFISTLTPHQSEIAKSRARSIAVPISSTTRIAGAVRCGVQVLQALMTVAVELPGGSSASIAGAGA
jgi:hypothetical protein